MLAERAPTEIPLDAISVEANVATSRQWDMCSIADRGAGCRSPSTVRNAQSRQCPVPVNESEVAQSLSRAASSRRSAKGAGADGGSSPLVAEIDAEGLPSAFLRVTTGDEEPKRTCTRLRFLGNARGKARRDEFARALEVRLRARAYGTGRDLRGNAASGEDLGEVAASPTPPRGFAKDVIGDQGLVERADLAEARDRPLDRGPSESSRGQPRDQLGGGEPATSERANRFGERARRLIGSRLQSSRTGRFPAIPSGHAAAHTGEDRSSPGSMEQPRPPDSP